MGHRRTWASRYLRVAASLTRKAPDVLRVVHLLRHQLKRAIFRFVPELLQEVIDLVYYEQRLRKGTLLDEPELALLDRLVHPGDTVVDIGANLGAYSLRLHELVGPQGLVHACEPVPRTFRLLCFCCHRIRKYDNLRFHEVAVSSSPGTAEFILPIDGVFGHPNYYVGGLKDQNREARRFPVRVESLDHWDVLSSARVSFVKIDVEGAEVEVVQGGLKLLARELPSIVCETNASNLVALNRLLEPLGYQAWECDERGQLLPLAEGGGPRSSPNCLFLHPSRMTGLGLTNDAAHRS